MRTAPPSLGATTKAAHHGVGLCTGDMTPRLCMRSSSVCTLVLNGIGIFLGANRANGWWLGFSLIVYSCANVPGPVNNDEYCDVIFFSTVHMFSKVLHS